MQKFGIRHYFSAHLATLAKQRDAIDSERGATAVEYSLLVAFIATVIVGTVLALGGQLLAIFGNISTAF